MVVALPAVEKPRLPPLHAVNPTDIYCASRDDLVLPVEGATLAFSNAYAHDITLVVSGKDGKPLRLPAHADAAQGAYVVTTARRHSADLGATLAPLSHGY